MIISDAHTRWPIITGLCFSKEILLLTLLKPFHRCNLNTVKTISQMECCLFSSPTTKVFCLANRTGIINLVVFVLHFWQYLVTCDLSLSLSFIKICLVTLDSVLAKTATHGSRLMYDWLNTRQQWTFSWAKCLRSARIWCRTRRRRNNLPVYFTAVDLWLKTCHVSKELCSNWI